MQHPQRRFRDLMTVDERSALAELKRRVGALPEDFVVSGDVDAAFRRFLVARKWDVDKAEEQLRATLTWRNEQFRVQAFLANPPRERLALVRSLLPANPHLGFAKEGWPVTLINVGSSDPTRAAKELTGDDLVADLVVRAEFYRATVFPEATRRAGRLIDKEVVLLDFGGMSLSLLKLKGIFSTMNGVGSRYFPERTVLFFILNAPGLFSMMWNVVKGLVDPRTQKKIHVLSSGSRQLEALRQHLPDDVIPVAYGGSRPGPTCCGSSVEETAKIYARLDAWLAAQAAPVPAKATRDKDVSAPAQALTMPAPPVAALDEQDQRKRADISSATPGSADPPELSQLYASSCAHMSSMRPLDFAVLLLLWVLSSGVFACLAWAQLQRR